MLKWLQARNNNKVDEHDEPTEPIPHVVPPSPSSVDERTEPSGEEGLPVFQLHTRPLPGQQAHNVQQPLAPAAPPPSPAMAADGSSQPTRRTLPTQIPRNLAPLLVGMCFVSIQLLLLVRFLLKLIALSASGWIGTFYALSGVFVIPFRLIVPDIVAPFHIDVEVYTLLAILVYGLLSRLLVHMLKVFLRQH